jgi:ribose transport system permease protein
MTVETLDPRTERGTPLAGVRTAVTRYGLFVVPVILLLIVAIPLPSVLSVGGLTSLLILASVLGIASIGQTWAIVLGGIDLSIPAVIGMGCVAVTTLTAQGMPFAATAGVIAVVAILVGVVNGVLTSMLAVHPLVITIGVGSIVTGAVLIATNGNTGGTVPPFITSAVSPIGTTLFLPIPLSIVLWAALGVVVILIEKRTVFGRQLFAVGSNLTAARYALARPWLIRTGVYVASALCAAIAGVLLAGFSGSAAVDIGDPYMFQTLTAVVVGGTSLLGGRGGYARTIVGVLVTSEFTMLLIGFSVGPSLQQVFLGIAILILIILYGRDRHVAQRL